MKKRGNFKTIQGLFEAVGYKIEKDSAYSARYYHVNKINSDESIHLYVDLTMGDFTEKIEEQGIKFIIDTYDNEIRKQKQAERKAKAEENKRNSKRELTIVKEVKMIDTQIELIQSMKMKIGITKEERRKFGLMAKPLHDRREELTGYKHKHLETRDRKWRKFLISDEKPKTPKKPVKAIIKLNR